MAWEWMLGGVRGGHWLLWSAGGAWSLEGEAEGRAQQCTDAKTTRGALECLASWMPLVKYPRRTFLLGYKAESFLL